MTVWIGTSGWQYRDWRGPFYPTGLPQRAWFTCYTQHFATVEVNNTFYRLPDRARFEAWARQAPPGFVVAVKASRYLSHVKRLAAPAEPITRLMDAARGLGDRLGPVLVQLPPNFQLDTGRLAGLLAAWPPDVRLAIEVRHPSWFTDEVRELLTGARGRAVPG